MSAIAAIPTMLWHAMPPEVNTSRLTRAVAVPGILTTAYLALQLFALAAGRAEDLVARPAEMARLVDDHQRIVRQVVQQRRWRSAWAAASMRR